LSSNESHLHCADHPAWRHEPDYNAAIAPHLARAYATIRQVPDRVASYREAGYHVITLRDLAMCRQQRLNVCYVLGMAHSADDEYPDALPWLDRAVVLARALADQSAQADLLYLRGLVAYRMNRCRDALDDYRVALRLHRRLRRDLRGEATALDGEQELHLLIAAAGFALTQEDYDLTRRLLSAARRRVRS
jgi:tetratricopeptide (TPR) repeat protein